MNDKLKYKLNEIATFCFRDVADHDYIAARVLFRLGLIQQAYWSSEQAVEKYLKSILLFNEVSAKNLGHNLSKTLSRIEKIPNFKMEIPDDVWELIIELNNEGDNRYYEYPYSYYNLTFWKLDRLVWHIRRYCVSSNIFVNIGDTEINLQQFEIAISHNDRYKKNPSKYKLSINGVLETILSNKKSILRKQLIWKNQYFGLRQKRKIKNVHSVQSFGNPPHFEDKRQIDELNEYIQFSKKVIEYIKRK